MDEKDGVAAEPVAVELDLLELVQRQLLIVKDAAETGLLLVQALRQGRGRSAGVEELEKKLSVPATFMAKKPPEGE